MDQIENQAREAVAQVLQADVEQSGDPRLIHLSTGVVLTMKQVSPFLINLLNSKFPDPPVPEVFIESKGRTEPNPLDPEYVALRKRTDEARQEAIINLFMGKGTELVNRPETIPAVEDDGWVEDLLDFSGDQDEYERIMQNPRYRYVAWVKYVAMGTKQDIELLNSRVLQLMGISAEDVAEEVRKFPGNP
ncbi:MAG TPA: hypothetical protein PKD55_00280 [Bellilinea sp.]|nr:hypothetical protein [Bellilinea sp.]